MVDRVLIPHLTLSHLISSSPQSDPTHEQWRQPPPAASIRRARALLQLPPDPDLYPDPDPDPDSALPSLTGKYGLGDRRTYAQLVAFSGVDPRTRLVTDIINAIL